MKLEGHNNEGYNEQELGFSEKIEPPRVNVTGTAEEALAFARAWEKYAKSYGGTVEFHLVSYAHPESIGYVALTPGDAADRFRDIQAEHSGEVIVRANESTNEKE